MKSLIVGPAWVGDMVMAQTLFSCLKLNDPDGEIDVLAPAWTQPLLERMPEVNKALAMPVGHGKVGLGVRYSLGKALRSENYQQAIVLPNSFKSALVPLFAKVALRTGWRGEARSWILNDSRILNKQNYPLMVQRFAALAFSPDAELPKSLPYPALTVSAEALIKLQHKFSLEMDRPVLILCPGAEFGASKKWPAEYYAELAQNAIKAGQQVWVLGSVNDQPSGEIITRGQSLENSKYCLDFTGETLLGEAIDLMSLATTVVSNDSGLMHIAAALKKPLVVIYGSTSAAFTPPLADKVKILSLDLECSPCFKRECPLQHLDCLQNLKPKLVWQAIGELHQ